MAKPSKPIDPNNCGIYQFISPSGNCYIGQSRSLRSRRGQHLSSLRQNKHKNFILQRAFNAYGDALVYSVLELCNLENLTEREQWWIDNTKSAYNIASVASAPMSDPNVAARNNASKVASGVFDRLPAHQRAQWAKPGYRDKVVASLSYTNALPETKARRSAAKRCAGIATVYNSVRDAGILLLSDEGLKSLDADREAKRNLHMRPQQLVARQLRRSLKLRGELATDRRRTLAAVQISNEKRYARLRDTGLLLMSDYGLRLIERHHNNARHATPGAKPDEATLAAMNHLRYVNLFSSI